jgi:hypothetical protein
VWLWWVYVALLVECASVHVTIFIVVLFSIIFWEEILFFFKNEVAFCVFLFVWVHESYVVSCLFMWALVIFFEL